MNIWKKFKRFCTECKRVLVVTKKPTGTEFKTIMKVAGLGIIVIGLLGFIVMMLASFIKSFNF